MPLRLDRMAELDAALAAGAILLVPNYRSSDQLVDQVCQMRRQEQPNGVLRRPAIRAIDLWFTELWSELTQLHETDALQRRVLQPVEELLLWQQLIHEQAPELLLLNRDGTAATIAEAWRVLQQWQVPLSELRKHLSLAGDTAHRDDREYAWLWLQAFEQLCRSRQLLTFSGMLQQLLHFIEDGTLARLQLLPPAILLTGFDAPPPLYRALFAALQAQGVSVGDWRFAPGTPQLALHACAEPAGECQAAASWAEAVLRQDPLASIGVVTNDTQLLKGDLERSFAQAFASAPHTFSTMQAGVLTDAAYVHAALASLALLADDIDTLQCCALLRSPWLLEADAEQDARAELELRLRRSQALRVRTVQLREWCLQEGKPWHCPALGDVLVTLQQRRLRQPRRQPLQAWLQFFAACWDALLPRAVLLQSGNRALVKAWEGLLKQAQLSSALLSNSFGSLDCEAAAALVTRMARASALPTANTQARIQLLTPVMAAGLHFTHLWCMQMTEALWPGDQPANPYLPLNLQREHAMPGADRNAHLHEVQELLHGLMARTAHEVVFSHAVTADDLPQRCTALLPTGLPEHAPAGRTASAGLHPALAHSLAAELELVDDATIVPLRVAAVEGGSGIIASQSSCPFKAFAQYRLQARELPRPVYGLPAHALGACIHEALQLFWRGMQSHAALVAAGAASLHDAVEQALVPALNRLARDYPTVLTPALRTLELRRLTNLLQRWLDVERARGPFTVVATEQELLWSLPRLQLRLRIDRIDRHADGSSVIVDYKTGMGTTLRWEDERPASPQLLLYQLALDAAGRHAESGALLYARVNVEEPAYTGIARDGSVYPGLAFNEQKSVTQTDWQSLKQLWQRALGMLADEFLQGYAAVQPARRDSCNYCHLGSLCRIGELRGIEAPEPAPLGVQLPEEAQ